jgi:hypothetical protein
MADGLIPAHQWARLVADKFLEAGEQLEPRLISDGLLFAQPTGAGEELAVYGLCLFSPSLTNALKYNWSLAVHIASLEDPRIYEEGNLILSAGQQGSNPVE